uniref:SprT-like domain-containing protein n=1 Tax=Babesia bovis TaxID=5865 RepID=A7ASZ4_BABBO|eukprot:XP_001609623.1 hypothetical protein [Babesia bovis T2Bo]
MIDLTCEIDEIDYELFDVHESFRHLNDICFDQSLSAVVLSWSKKMTVSAGRCRFKENRYCEIILSEPILKYRSAKECEETLLHEMIHAYLFLTKKSKTLNAHGKVSVYVGWNISQDFIWHMNRVNDITGLNVDIYHNFIDEVEYNRRHVWRCSVSYL